LIPHEEAFKRLTSSISARRLNPEKITLEEADGRVLAEGIVSEVNIPSVNHAVFDGYAIRSADTEGAQINKPVVLKIVDEAFPGEKPLEMRSGQTIYNACGGPLPLGADAVVKVENTRLRGKKIEVCFPLNFGENVALAGEDIKCGEPIFGRGQLLRPQDVGALAGLGLKHVKVFRKPKVGIISVGDELVLSREKDPFKIVNNYALIISFLTSELGGDPYLYGIVPDDLELIKEKISEAAKETDIIATIAGCSVGKKDFVPDAIQALDDLGIVFHGIKLSPGRVIGAGVVKGKPVIMLPGHIVSTYAGFYLFLGPLIVRFSGSKTKGYFPIVKARLAQKVKRKPTATFLRLHLARVDGEYKANPVHGGSGRLTTLISSNGFTVVPRGKGLDTGSLVNVVLFDRYEFAQIKSRGD
jgi:molybdenum cofactor synthesis domain-containing protein